MTDIDTFEKLLAKGPDSAMLRYTLGNAYMQQSEFETSIEHLLKALKFDDQYSAAWKLLGRCYLESGEFALAIDTCEKGIAVAEEKGDKQAAKEMNVFLKRAKKKLAE